MKFWKKNNRSGEGSLPEERSFVAEALEPRILYSGAPVDAVTVEAPVEEASAQSDDNEFQSTEDFDGGIPLSEGEFGLSETVVLSSLENLTEGEIEYLAQVAAQNWRDSGLDEAQMEALQRIEFSVLDLDGALLGYAEGSHIFIDSDAAGEGWFVDSTPFEDEEFYANVDGGLSAITGSEADDRIDLLSVLQHEIGHVLGLEDVYQSIEKTEVMYGLFEDGERRTVLMDQAKSAEALSLEGAHYALADQVILSTDFSGRTVSGTTASNITWTANGVEDPGDITVSEDDVYGNGIDLVGFHETSDATGHFAPDLNIHNEGAWEASIPLVLNGPNITLTRATLDVQAFSNSGTSQSMDMDFTIEVVGSVSGSLHTQTVNDTSAAGEVSFLFPTPLSLSNAETYELKITSVGQGGGNNSGLDAISVFGFTAPSTTLVSIDFEDAPGSTIFSSGTNGNPSSIDTTVGALGATNESEANATNQVWGMNTEFSTAFLNLNSYDSGSAVDALNALPPGDYQLVFQYDQNAVERNAKTGFTLTGTNGSYAGDPRGGANFWRVHNAGNGGLGNNQPGDTAGDDAFSHIVITTESNTGTTARNPAILTIVEAGEPLTDASTFQQGGFTNIRLDFWNTSDNDAIPAEIYYDNISLSAIEVPAITEPLVNFTFDADSAISNDSLTSTANLGTLGGYATGSGTLNYADSNFEGELAAQFDEDSNFIIYDIPAGTLDADGDFTVAASVYIDGIQSQYDRILDPFFSFNDNTTSVRFHSSEQQIYASEPLSTGWHHLALTIDADASSNSTRVVARAYIDGIVVNTDTSALRPDFSGGLSLAIGNQSNGNRPITGLVDDIVIFDSLKLPEAVAAIANPVREVYVNGAWAQQSDIADGDLETGDVETATFGANAFATLSEAVDALDYLRPVTLIINPGDYSGEILDLTAFSNEITVKFVEDDTRIGGLIGGPNVTIELGGVDGIHNASTTLTIESGNFTGVISGDGGITKSGGQTLTLSAANTYEGGTTLEAGTLDAAHITGLGKTGSTVTLNGGTLQLSTSRDTDDYEYNLHVGGIATLESVTVRKEWVGEITGDGTITINGKGLLLRGDMSTFSGELIQNSDQFHFAINDNLIFSAGSRLATFTINAGANYLLNNSNSGTVYMGALQGTGGTLYTKYARSGSVVFEVGHLNVDTTYSGRISDNGQSTYATPTPTSLTKVGTGILTLTGNSDYSGPTNVNTGTLLVNGNNSGATGAVNVADGAALGGAGTVGGAVIAASGSDIRPGIGGVGELRILADITINGDLEIDISDDITDLLDIDGVVTLSATSTVTVSGAPKADVYTIIDNDGTGDTLSTFFSNYANGAVVEIGGIDYKIVYNGGDGNDVLLVKAEPKVVYVNEDWSGTESGMFLDGNLETGAYEQAVFGYTAFSSIQDAVNALGDGSGTVIVNAGDYGITENVDLETGAGDVTLLLVRDLDADPDETGVIIGSIKAGTADRIVLGGNGTAVALDITSDSEASSIAGEVSGLGGVTKSGGQALTLSAANTYEGGTTLEAGTLDAAHITGLGKTDSTVTLNGGTLQLSTSRDTDDYEYNLHVGGIATLESVTVRKEWVGEITGDGTITINGKGLLLRGDMSTFSGELIQNSDQFHFAINDNSIISAGSKLATFTINSGIIYLLNNSSSGTVYLGALQGTGGAIYGKFARSGDVVLEVGHLNQHTTYSGSIADNGQVSTSSVTPTSLTKVGTGTLTLSGDNTYSGTTTVDAGILSVASNTALGGTGGGTSVSINASLSLADGVTVTGEELTIEGSGGAVTNGSSVITNYRGALQAEVDSNAEWAGDVILGVNNTRLGAQSDGVLTVSGTISDGASGYDLEISTSATPTGPNGSYVVLKGGNTYGGNTDIIRGTLVLGVDNSLPVGTTLNVDYTTATEASTFDLAGYDQQIGGLTRTGSSGGGAAVITNSNTGQSSVLTVNQSSNTNFSGQLTGNLDLVKDGSGKLSLSGNNSYSGSTTINGGTLRLEEPAPLPVVMTAVTASASSNYTGRGPGNTTDDSGMTVDADGISQTVNSTSPTTMWMSPGTKKIDEEWIAYDFGSVQSLTSVHVWNFNQFQGTTSFTSRGIDYVLIQTSEDGVNFTTVKDTNFPEGTGNGDPGFDIVFDSAIHSQYVRFQVVTSHGDPSYVGLSEVQFYSAAVIPPNSDVSLTKSGATLEIADGQSVALNSLSGVAGSEVKLGDGTLSVGLGNSDTTFAGAITGSGALTKTGSGTLSLAGGSSNYSGGTTITNGVLEANNESGSATGTGDVTVEMDGALGGEGAVAGAIITNGGEIAPGLSSGPDTTDDLSLGSLDLDPTSTVTIEIDSNVENTGYDQLDVSGTVMLDGATLNLVLNAVPSAGVYTIINQTGSGAASITEFSNYTDGQIFELPFMTNSYAFQIHYDGGDGNDVVLTSFGIPETSVELVGEDLVITDINNDGQSNDDLTITEDDTYYIISDSRLVLTTSSAGFEYKDANTIRVLKSAVTGGLIVNTLGEETASGDTVTIGSNVSFDGDITINAEKINLGGDITTTGTSGAAQNGDVTLNGTVTLTGNVVLDTSNVDGAISLNGTVDGTYDLTLISGSRNVNVAGKVGGGTTLDSLIILDSGTVTFGDTVSAASFQQTDINSSVVFQQQATFTGLFDQVAGDVTAQNGLTADELIVATATVVTSDNDITTNTSTLSVTGGAVVIGDGDGSVIFGQTTIPLKDVRGVIDFAGADSVIVKVAEIKGALITGGGADGNQSDGDLIFSTTGVNLVEAGSILIGHSIGSGNVGNTTSVVFGANNTVKTDTFTVGGGKSRAEVTIADMGTLNLSGLTGDGKADLYIGDNNINTGVNTYGTMDLSNGTFDATLGALVLARHNYNSTSPGNAEGLLVIGGGEITADTVALTLDPSGDPENSRGTLRMLDGLFTVANGVTDTAAVSELDIQGGTFVVAAGGLSVDTLTVGQDKDNTGVLTVSGGDVRVGTGVEDLIIGGYATTVAGVPGDSVGTVDFSNASTVTIEVARAELGVARVSSGTTGSTSNSAKGTLLLSEIGMNTVTADSLMISEAGSGKNQYIGSKVTLGTTNTLNIDTITVGANKGNGLLDIVTNGEVTINGKAGSPSLATLIAGDNNVNTSTRSTGVVDFRGGDVTGNFDEISLGIHGRSTSTNGRGIGSLYMDDGTIKANTVSLALPSQIGDSAGAASTTGHIGLEGGTFQVGTLQKGDGTATFDWSGGTIQNLPGQDLTNVDVEIDLVGTDAHSIEIDTAQTGTFQSEAILSNEGSLTKTGDGVLVLQGENAYLGDTTVEAGTIQLDGVTPVDMTGVTASASSEFGGRPASEAVDPSDLVGGAHPGSTSTMWMSTPGTVGSQWIQFDFGSERLLSGAHIWNYGQTNFETRGINGVEIQTSTDGTNFSTVQTGNFDIGTGDGDIGFDFEFDTLIETQFLRFQVVSTHGDNSYVGLSEVQFFETSRVLPPTTALTLTTSGATLDVSGNVAEAGSISGVAGTSVLLGGGKLIVGNDNSNTRFDGVISEAGDFTKVGAGDLLLGAANTYTGDTSILGGTVTTFTSEGLGSSTDSTLTVSDAILNLFDDADAVTTAGTVDLSAGTGTINTGSAGGILAVTNQLEFPDGVKLNYTPGDGEISFSVQSEDLVDGDVPRIVTASGGTVAVAAEIPVNPASVAASTNYNLRMPDRTIDDSGMIVDEDGISLTLASSVPDSTMWLSNGVNPLEDQYITYDFGSVQEVNAVHIWNYAQANFTRRGIKDVTIQYSTDGIEFTDLQTAVFPESTGEGDKGFDVNFESPVEARYIRFDVDSSHKAANINEEFVGLSEVQFYTRNPVDLNSSHFVLDGTGATLDVSNHEVTIASLSGVSGTSAILDDGVLTVGDDVTSTEFAGVISGDGGLIKTGDSALTLSGINTYTGSTELDDGTLTVTGEIGNGGPADTVTLKSNTTLNVGGKIYAPILSEVVTSNIVVTADSELGDGSNSGFDFDGTLEVGSHNVTILDGNEGLLGRSTSIDGGTLTSDGGLNFGSDETVLGHGTIDLNNGTDPGTFNVFSGTLSPGDSTDSTGTISLEGNVDLGSGLFTIDLNGVSGGDLLDVTGAVDLDSAKLKITTTENLDPGSTITIISNDSADSVTSIFKDAFGNDLPEGAVVTSDDGQKFIISYTGGTNHNDVVLFVGEAVTQAGFNPVTGVLTITDVTTDSDNDITIVYNSTDDTYTITDAGNLIRTVGFTSAQITRPDFDTLVIDGDLIKGIVVDTDGTQTGDTVTISTTGTAVSLSDGLSVTSGDIVINGDVTLTGGNVSFSAGGAVTIADDSLVDAGSGNIDIDAGDDVTLGGLETTGTVTIDSAAGNIIDGGDTHVDIEASSAVLNASNGTVGAGSALVTAVSNLSGVSNGEFAVTNSGDLTVGGIAAGGNVALRVDEDFLLDEGNEITSGGTITIDVFHAGAGPAEGSIISVLGNVDAGENGVYITGGDGVDIFTISPNSKSIIYIDGGNPPHPEPVGDVLNIVKGNDPLREEDLSTPGSGKFTFTGGQKDIEYVDIERDNVPTLDIEIPISQRLSPTLLRGEFVDFGGDDTHTLTVDWKNGISTFAIPSFTGGLSAGSIASSTDGAVLTITSADLDTGKVEFTVTHTYTTDGLYNVEVSVVDFTGALAEANQVAEVYFLAPSGGSPGYFSSATLPGQFTLNGHSGLFTDLRVESLFATDGAGRNLSVGTGVGQTSSVSAFFTLEGEVRVVVLTEAEVEPEDLLSALNNSILYGTPLDLQGNDSPLDSSGALKLIQDLIRINVVQGGAE